MTDPALRRPRRPLNDKGQAADQPSADKPPAGQPPARWRDLAEEAIEEAMRSGAFDDLPGRGKPLNLLTNPYAPGTELAYQLLKDNQYTLPWISERVSLLARIQDLQDEITSSWRWYQGEYRASADDSYRLGLIQEWSVLATTWEERIRTLNDEIATVNLKQPGGALEILKLALDRELARAGARRALG
jgi:DnaJ family protein C protein 28